MLDLALVYPMSVTIALQGIFLLLVAVHSKRHGQAVPVPVRKRAERKKL